MSRMRLDAIVVGNRARQQLGDVEELARSIADVGLLQPIVVRPDSHLVAGHRRLEALRLLGWVDAPVHVAADLDSTAKLLRAERDENTCRLEMARSEAAALGLQMEAAEESEARERQRLGQELGRRVQHGEVVPETVSGTKTATEVEAGRVRAVVGAAVGMSGPTYQRAKAIVVAAKEDPDRFGDLVETMDTKGVRGAFTELRRRQVIDAPDKPAKAEKPPRKAPGAPVVIYKGNPPAVILANALISLEAICDTFDKLDAPAAGGAEQADALKHFARRLHKFANQMSENGRIESAEAS